MKQLSIQFYSAFKDDFDKLGIDVIRVYNTLTKYKSRIVEDKDAVAIYALITDSSLSDLVSGKKSLKDVFGLLEENGDNVHFLMCVAKGTGSLKRLIDKVRGNTVSWFKPNHNLVVFKRRQLCHL